VKRGFCRLLTVGLCSFGAWPSAAEEAPPAPEPDAPAASFDDLPSPRQADTRYSAYSVPGSTWAFGLGALGIGGGDAFAKLGAAYGFGSGFELGVNLAHLGVGLFNVTAAWHFIDTRHFDLGLRAGVWYGRGEWFWTAQGLVERIVSNLDVLSVPIALTGTVPIERWAQLDLGVQYSYAQLYGSGADSPDSSPFTDAELGQRQFFFRPVARWFASDNTALELSAKLPVNTVVALKSSSPEVPFSDTWAVEGGLRSRLVPDVFGSLRLHYGRVSSALYGAQLYPSFELEMRF